mmetsp:Transcript_6657/g.17130  ORF Transcript_6657/g.17130 Transcript_6657/m.17130 type:complete len:434 (+) Transcript_6657:101-1402(+)
MAARFPGYGTGGQPQHAPRGGQAAGYPSYATAPQTVQMHPTSAAPAAAGRSMHPGGSGATYPPYSAAVMHPPSQAAASHGQYSAGLGAATAAGTTASSATHPSAATSYGGSLPQGWVAAADPKTGHTYYSNAALGLTQWEAPAAAAPQAEVPPPPPAAPIASTPTKSALPPGWVAAIDGESGLPYYFNAELRQTQWDRPGQPAHPPTSVTAAAHHPGYGAVPAMAHAHPPAVGHPAPHQQQPVHMAAPSAPRGPQMAAPRPAGQMARPPGGPVAAMHVQPPRHHLPHQQAGVPRSGAGLQGPRGPSAARPPYGGAMHPQRAAAPASAPPRAHLGVPSMASMVPGGASSMHAPRGAMPLPRGGPGPTPRAPGPGVPMGRPVGLLPRGAAAGVRGPQHPRGPGSVTLPPPSELAGGPMRRGPLSGHNRPGPYGRR